MPNRERYGGKQRGGHRRHDSESDYSGSFSDESSDGGSAAAGPLSMLADGLLGMVAAKKPREQDVEDRLTATSQGDHRYHKHKMRPPRGLSRPRRRDDGSVLSGISEATKIRSGVMTKEPIAVCSTTAYGSDFLPMSQAVPPKKKGYFLRSGPKPSQPTSKGKKGNGKKTGPRSNDKSDVSIVTESPMPINVSSGFASKQWARKFDEKDAINNGPQRVQIGKNGAVTYTATSTHRLAGGKRHYYMGVKSTKRPLGKKHDPHYIGRHSMLSDTMASEVTSHQLNSLPRQHSQSRKGAGNSTAYDGETIETIPTKEMKGQSFSTFGHDQNDGLHRYGNYSLPDPGEKDRHSTSVPDDMESVASSTCSRSVRIKTKRRGAETNEVELEMLLEEESLSGSSSGSEDDDSEFSVSVVHEEGNDDEEEVDGLPGQADVSVGDSGSTSTSSASSSASSRITSARSEASSVEHKKDKNVAPSVGNKYTAAPVVSVNVRSDNGSNCSDSSSDTSAGGGQDINESEPPLPRASKSIVQQQHKEGEKKYHASKTASVTVNTSNSISDSQDAPHAKREKTWDRRDPSTRPPLPSTNGNRRKSNASQPSPRPPSTHLDKSKKKTKKREKELEKMREVELDVLGPVNSPMQQNTNFVQDQALEKKSGFVKETVENMLEAAFSPDGENLRSYNQNDQKGRTFRPKIPFFDSMTSSDESEQTSVKDWADVESWCSSVEENATKDVSRWERRVKYPNKKNKKGWYAKPVEEIKNKQGYEVDVVQLGLKKGGKDKNKGKGKGKAKEKARTKQQRKIPVQSTW